MEFFKQNLPCYIILNVILYRFLGVPMICNPNCMAWWFGFQDRILWTWHSMGFLHNFRSVFILELQQNNSGIQNVSGPNNSFWNCWLGYLLEVCPLSLVSWIFLCLIQSYLSLWVQHKNCNYLIHIFIYKGRYWTCFCLSLIKVSTLSRLQFILGE